MKHYLKLILSQQRLNILTLLSIEKKICNEFDYNNLLYMWLCIQKV